MIRPPKLSTRGLMTLVAACAFALFPAGRLTILSTLFGGSLLALLIEPRPATSEA